MFKIRSPYLNDFAKLEELFKESSSLQELCNLHSLKKLSFCSQGIIPSRFRFIPSLHLAVEDKKILGFVVLQALSQPNNCWQINEVFVTNEMRNKGIGEELVRYVLSVYGSQGIEYFIVEVDSLNLPAISLFHHCGFRRYAKIFFYEKEINTSAEMPFTSILNDKDFTIRPQNTSDLAELEKIDLSSIPADLRPALGKSQKYFKENKNSIVLINKPRNLLIGWIHFEKTSDENYFAELLMLPGWTHLYENFLGTLIADLIAAQCNKFKLTVKVFDYITELNELLIKHGFLPSQVKELLARTVLQKVKEKKTAQAKIGVPRAAPT